MCQPTDFSGVDTFTYTITDGKGGTSTTTVTVNVGGVNDAPIANPDTGSTNEDTVLNVTALNGVILGAPGTDVDPEGDTLSVDRVAFGATVGTVGQPLAGTWGTLVLRPDGSYTYTPAPRAQALDDGESQSDVFTYRATDGGGLSSTTTLTLTVTGVNDGPVAIDDRAVTPEDTPITLAVLTNDSDPENDPLTITAINGQPVVAGAVVRLTDTATGDLNGTVRLNPDGTLRFVPESGFNGPLSFTYTITDGDAQDTATVNLTVDSINDPPIAEPDLVTGPEDTVLTFDPRANDADPENDPLTITAINGQPINVNTPVQLTEGRLTMNDDGTLSFRPNPNFNGEVNFGYTVSDGALTDDSTVNILIRAVNDLPAGTDAVETTPEDIPYVLTIDNFGFSDPDVGDTLAAVRIDTLPTAGTLLLGGAPVAAGTLVSAAQIAAGALTFAPAPNENGSPYGRFTFSVQDSSGGFDPVPNTFVLNVTPVSDSPAAGDDRATTPEDTPILIDVLANDTDADRGDVLSITAVNGTPVTVGGAYSAVNGPAGTPVGTVQLVISGGSQQLLFTPAPNYNGPANFSYTVTDGLTPVSAQVAVTVTPVNDPPVANPDNISTPEDTPVVIAVLANDADVDGDALTVNASFTQPTNGSVVLNPNGTFTYTPGADFAGTDTFTYSVRDPSGARRRRPPSRSTWVTSTTRRSRRPTSTPPTKTPRSCAAPRRA